MLDLRNRVRVNTAAVRGRTWVRVNLAAVRVRVMEPGKG